MKTTIIDFDVQRYDFRKWAREVLSAEHLETIHLFDKIKLLNKNPTCNQLSDAFSSIIDTYRQFIINVIAKNFGDIANYQSPPSFRFHYCGYGSSVFHRDRDFGVKQGKVNVWIPLTDVWGDNSLWVESEEGSRNHKPISLKYGQALIFDGVNMNHGSKINTTSSTRISFDFRFQPGCGPAVPTSY